MQETPSYEMVTGYEIPHLGDISDF